MNATFAATGLRQTAVLTRRGFNLFRTFWDTFQERRARQKLRAVLFGLSDRELMDIGTTRAEVDYVASNAGVDRQGV
jgi:uncharacterized protein YjiS (DUF1127 family)